LESQEKTRKAKPNLIAFIKLSSKGV